MRKIITILAIALSIGATLPAFADTAASTTTYSAPASAGGR
jgi:hypothetical protein